MKLKYGTNDLWPTQILKGKIEDKQLAKVCDSIFTTVDLDKPPNDFQEEFDILIDGPKELRKFKKTVVIPAFENYLNSIGTSLKEFQSYKLRAWMTGVKNGYMLPIHNHCGSHFSGVFYLMCEESDKGGELIAVDPRGNANRGYLDEFKPLFQNLVYQPTSGDYVIFPSYLYHHTNVFTGSLRLAMPVDLFLMT